MVVALLGSSIMLIAYVDTPNSLATSNELSPRERRNKIPLFSLLLLCFQSTWHKRLEVLIFFFHFTIKIEPKLHR